MTDRELLELAAKAAGIRIASEPSYSEEYGIETYDGWSWNPLRSDGNALRLAVKLHIDLDQYADSIRCKKSIDFDGAEGLDDSWEMLSPDPYAATRRAIVRASAEIGKEMP